MAAPKGNRFWELRSKHGRDKLFETPELMWEAACEYFKWCQNNPFMEVQQAKVNPVPIKDEKTGKYSWPPNLIELPKMRPFTLHGLCLYMDCGTAYFRNFKSEERAHGEGFKSVIAKIEEVIYNQKFSGAASGFFNSNIIARDLGLKDSIEQDITSKGQSINTSINIYPPGVEELEIKEGE